ncbi:MAG: beta-N-acetylhexosaminidase [Corallococcus sp.]|nr:beta-N-acetylhexosaminidase [Bacillota bacterium]MCM1534049.1 beta-N-acetylhexosaminidase [Corallococcus sp.]
MKILPQPKKFEKISGVFTIDESSVIYCNGELRLQAERFAKMVLDSSGVVLPFTEEIDGAKIIFDKDENIKTEGYFVMLSQGLATITCGSATGCFYAVETLRQLFYLDRTQTEITCGNCYIEDEPKFAYRGQHIDISRHFFGLDVLKRIVELMSQVKLNKLHLHLTDDQGFRIQIDKYPLLTKIGSVRSGSEKVKNGKRYVDDEVVEGYLTKDDVKELVAFAHERNVDIVPEIDLPGHFVAALAAYPEYSCAGQVSEVRKQWGISKDVLCVGNDAAYTFVCDILDEICDLFPYEYVHLGGDEVPRDRWCNCKLCRERLAELKLKDFDALQTYMVEQFRIHLESKGKKVICWNDGITGATSKEIVSQVWKPFTKGNGVKEANDGRRIILSPFFDMYFDYPYAMTPLKRTLKFNPLKGIRKNRVNNVWGVEGCLWTEYVDSQEKLFFNLLPRLDALAECCWGYNGADFSGRLKKRYEVYDKANVVYNDCPRLKRGRNIRIINKFFKKDANIELNDYYNKLK